MNKKSTFFNRARQGELLFFLSIILVLFFLVFILKPDWTIRSDGFGCYKYIRSAIFDGDIDFANESQYFKEKFSVTEKTFYDQLTETGYSPNPFPIGHSILIAPWIIGAYTWEKIFDVQSIEPLGFSKIYDRADNLAGMFYGFCGLIIAYLFMRDFASKKESFLVVALILFATPLIYFMIYEAIWNHLTGFFVVSAFIFFWWKTREDMTSKRFIGLGALLGLCILVRWQHLLLGLFVLADLISAKEEFGTKEKIKKSILFAMTVFVVALPQLVAWKIIYGSFLIKPPSNSNFDYILNPKLVPFLFSPLYGMFFWTPIYVCSFLGLLNFWKKQSMVGVLFLLIILVQVYLNASLSDWFGGGLGGGSFGARRMLDYSLILAVGLLYFMKLFKHNIIRIGLSTLFIFLIMLNISLMIQSAKGWLVAENPYTGNWGRALISPKAIWENSGKIFIEFGL